MKDYVAQRSSSCAKDERSYDVQKFKYSIQKKFPISPCFASKWETFFWLHSAKDNRAKYWKFHYVSHINLQQLQHQILIYQLVPSAVLFGKYEHSLLSCSFQLANEWQTILSLCYSHLSNNRGGWNKHVGVKKLQNQLDFFHQFLC